VPPLINTIPFTVVSPLNCNAESTEALANREGTIIQDAVESFSLSTETIFFSLLLQEKSIAKTTKKNTFFINFIQRY
jgi:hypothetical protein